MNKAIGVTLTVVVVLVALAFGGRMYTTQYMARRALTPKALGSATPDSAGVPFARVVMTSGDRTLIGWWVRAPGDSGQPAPALLFFHGNRSAISDYVALQRFFYRQGISSLVFDYTGFGASGGEASLTHAVSDAASAVRLLRDSAGATRRVAMGSALGATVLLQAIDSVQPHVQGIVIEGTDASVRESAVRAGSIPNLLAPFVVDIADNVAAATRVRVPLLAVHSFADERAPFENAERVVNAVPGPVSLVRHWRRGHSALLTSSRPCDWAPVLAFIKHGTLPPAKVDTVNACELAERQAAADSVDRAARARAAMGATGATTNVPAAKAPATQTPATKAPPSKTSRTSPR